MGGLGGGGTNLACPPSCAQVVHNPQAVVPWPPMWPFKRRSDPSPDSAVSRSEFLEAVARLKVLERELEDLHQSYRRLRGIKAGEASAVARSGVPVAEPEQLALVGPSPSKKAELWRRFTAARNARMNGESAEKVR